MAHVQRKFSWCDHLNLTWRTEKSHLLYERSSVELLYQKLLKNLEVTEVQKNVLYENVPCIHVVTIPHDEIKKVTYLFLKCQGALMFALSRQSACSTLMEKHLAVLNRMLHADSLLYQNRTTSLFEIHKPKKNFSTPSNGQARSTLFVNNPFLEFSIKTGLSMVFSLLRENWVIDKSLRTLLPNYNKNSMSCGVLQAAVNAVSAMPPLSLSDDNLLTELGVYSLNEILKFLKSSCHDMSELNKNGQRLACELMLLMCLKRGHLCGMLDWIQTVLLMFHHPDLTDVADLSISHHQFTNILNEMAQIVSDAVKMIIMLTFNQTQLSLLANECISSATTKSILATSNKTKLPDCSTSGSAVSHESQNCTDVYAWGSNNSYQLGEGSQDKVLVPRLSAVFSAGVIEIEAGQYCTFVINKDGSMMTCGKNTFGRLGLGPSSALNSNPMQQSHIQPKFKKVSSSKGTDGHTLALSIDGTVYSWGDGNGGKLGHGDNVTVYSPKLIAGPLLGKVVLCVSAGYRHSAVVTTDGELYTWGDGEHGKLGLGDVLHRNVPTLVHDVKLASQVCCGSSHTLALSQEGWVVWSFGDGANGKLGHGDVARLLKPKIIEHLRGIHMKMLAATCQSSLALTSAGKLFSWGSGSCVGVGTEGLMLGPTIISTLQHVCVVDISAGDSHCLAVTKEGDVYAWGTNTMFQCGISVNKGPLDSPQKLPSLSSLGLNRVSAGTSHCFAWSTPQGNKKSNVVLPTLCVDLHETTFHQFELLIDKFMRKLDDSQPMLPFVNKNDEENFAVNCLDLLRTHFLFMMSRNDDEDVMEHHAHNIRQLLFDLIDKELSQLAFDNVWLTLTMGSPLLLPPLSTRLQLIDKLLRGEDQVWQKISKGKRIQLEILLKSLNNSSSLSTLLGFSTIHSSSSPSEVLTPTGNFMEIILFNIQQYSVSH
ncbi:hypothetical protein HELRODRAFT_90701 [Helobdella robusta]|uniref:RCC1-like domain-containing protein n=1 Tax=Helobdella robusta TaxID=6412 RepID=T1G7U6_HELRO|nr:hypothetical protein HELRODRAFT_90701 [Helobdella robusta]ESN90894.1 hypothetical protein HELRODRAFT_90701 [Helobdella robusta]